MIFYLKNFSKITRTLCTLTYFAKTRGARNIIGSFGSQLVSGDYHEDGETVVMEMASDPPCFLGHSLTASTSSSNIV